MTGQAHPSAPALDFVDAMRGIAALMVIAVHTAQRIPNLHPVLDALAQYCQMGVQLFFVASACTLCLSYRRRRDEPHALRAFYLRRFFRIAPLYYLAIPLYLGFDAALQLVAGRPSITFAPDLGPRILANVLFIHGFVPSANNTVVPGGWSIGTEMAFYAVFPALFALVDRAGGKGTVRLAVLAAGLTLANLLLQARVLDGSPLAITRNSFMYYNLLNQLPVFLVGFVAVRCLDAGSAVPRPAVSLGLFALLTGVALVLWRGDPSIVFTIIPGVSALSFLCLMQWLRTRRLERGLLVRIGRRSYSMYIVHFLFAWGPVALLAERFAGRVQPDLMFAASYLGVCACTYAVAATAGRRIEQWGIGIGRRLAGGHAER